MKKLIFTCAILACGSMISFAQSANTARPAANTTQTVGQNYNRPASHTSIAPERIAERRAKVQRQQLGLSEEQYQKVYAVQLDYAKQDQAMRANGQQPGEGPVMQAGMARDQKLQSILTPEQYTKYQSAKSNGNNQAANRAVPASSTANH